MYIYVFVSMYVHIKSLEVYSFVFILSIFHWGNIVKNVKNGGIKKKKKWRKNYHIAVGLSLEGLKPFCTLYESKSCLICSYQ